MGYYKPYEPKFKVNGKSLFQGITIGMIAAIVSFLFYSSFPMTSEHTVGAEEKNDKSITNLENVVYSYNQSTLNIPDAVEKVDDAVVSITTYQDNQFYFFQTETKGTGSGVIYKKVGDQAFVVTNHHVIDGGKKIEVTLNDGTKLEAEVVGSDVFTDLAVLAIDGTNVKEVATFGSSENLRLGETVIAIGSPLGDAFSGSVTQGIISGKDRTIPVDINGDGKADWQADVIQTDAAINPGNSGGALINLLGQVVGINSMKIAQVKVEGIGFAIPISIARPIIEDLELYHEVKRPYMGIKMAALSDVPIYHWSHTLNLPDTVKSGTVILEVVPNSPAEKAGLKQYDVITAVDQTTIANDIELRKYLYTKKNIGETMDITYYRNGKKQTTTIQLETQSTY